MMTLIAAAIAATAQPAAAATPAASPQAHAQHQRTAQHGQQRPPMGKMAEGCPCCKKMMEKMHSGAQASPAQDHREHGGN